TSLTFHMGSMHFGYQIPGGNIAERYGNNGYAGLSYFLKLKSNWIIEAQYDYIFGEFYGERTNFEGIYSQEGYFFTEDGRFIEVHARESGFFGGIKLGKIFPVFGSNPNSGILFQVGAGLLQYKTYLEETNDVPVLNDEYSKGWDRLTNGFALNQFIGYMHMSDRYRFNFFAGFEFYQAWTQNRRDYDFYSMQKMDNKNNDFLYSFKVGWLINFSKRNPERFYIY
ncbi:hypothetical protein ACFLRR_00525, partial [Bacteroidota bacterium]